MPRGRPAKKAAFTLDDYEAIAHLLECGYDIQATLQVIASKKNEAKINDLFALLSQGESIQDHLIDLSNLRVHFQFFFQYTSLAQALKQSIGMYRYEQQIKHNVIQTCFYPCLVMSFSLVCFLFMAIFVLPMMVDLLQSMGVGFDMALLVLIHGSTILLILLVLCVIVFVLLCRYCLRENHQVRSFLFLNRYFDEHILTFFHSYLWAGYWLVFQQQSFSTMDAIHYLKQMEHRPLAKYCAARIDEWLLEGRLLEKAMKDTKMVSERLCFAFEMGIKCQQVEGYLELYLEETRRRLEKRVKQVIHGIQLGSYVFVGLIVAVMSQMLFAPMDLLSSLG